MTAYSVGYAFGQLVLLFAFLVPAILFLRSQYNALAIIRPENRRMEPGLVWLQLIPIFNYVWTFIVVKKIADSLAREFAGRESDSIFEVADSAAITAYGKRPTFGIGLAYCILIACLPLLIIFFNLTVHPKNTDDEDTYAYLGFSMIALILGALVCWIIYWVQLAQFKNKLKRLRA